MRVITLLEVILFDRHVTLVDTLEAMNHAVDDLLLKFDEVGSTPKNDKSWRYSRDEFR